MKPKTTYLVLVIAGTILPYWQFVAWLAEHGLNGSLFLQQLFTNRISSFFALDVIISAVVLLYFVRNESSRLSIHNRWLPMLAVVLVGGSCGLPLFLYMREKSLQHGAAATAGV